MNRLITKNKTYSFNMDRGTKTIEKRETSSGWEDTAIYSDPIVENDFVALADNDYTVKNASAGDVVIGRVFKMPKPKIHEDSNECEVELYGEIHELPLKDTNAAINVKDRIALTEDGADKATVATPFLALESRTASDDKEVIDVFLALADTTEEEEGDG